MHVVGRMTPLADIPILLPAAKKNLIITEVFVLFSFTSMDGFLKMTHVG